MLQDEMKIAQEMLANTYGGYVAKFDGGEKYGKTWAVVQLCGHGAGALALSNFAVISGDLKIHEPAADWEILEALTMFGHLKALGVRLLTEDGQLTSAGLRMVEWYQRLDDYPIADEEHYSNTEQEIAANDIRTGYGHEVIDNPPPNWSYHVLYEMGELNYETSPDYMSHDEIRAAMMVLGYLKSDEPETPVIFRQWKTGNKIIAFFPTEPASVVHPGQCMSYEHVGQHGAADYHHCLKLTEPAPAYRYGKLLAELVDIGYTNLKIYRRHQHRFVTTRLEKSHVV